MKILLLITILGCCGYVGVQIKNNLKVKKEFYLELLNFCEHYKREINFLKTDLSSVLKTYIAKNMELKNVLNKFLLNEKIVVRFLKEDEQSDVINFLNKLGKQDVDGELNNIEFYESKFKNKLSECGVNYEKYGNFSVKMSAILGLLICILLI